MSDNIPGIKRGKIHIVLSKNNTVNFLTNRNYRKAIELRNKDGISDFKVKFILKNGNNKSVKLNEDFLKKDNLKITAYQIIEKLNTLKYDMNARNYIIYIK